MGQDGTGRWPCTPWGVGEPSEMVVAQGFRRAHAERSASGSLQSKELRVPASARARTRGGRCGRLRTVRRVSWGPGVGARRGARGVGCRSAPGREVVGYVSIPLRASPS